MDEFKITDEKMETALSVLICGCKERGCDKCNLDAECTYLFDIARNFADLKENK